MIYEPRDYQYEDISKIRDTYKAGSKATIYVSHTGSGKTIVFSYITERLYQNKQKILICTHRDNILQETSKKLTAIGLKHGIIAPGYPSVRYQIQLASIQTLVRRLNQWNFDWFDWMIFDECFVKGTKILTENGNKNIENIKSGDKVFTLNEETKQIEIKKVKRLIKKKRIKNLVKINNILCTENHKIYTQRGWIEAKNIKKGGDMMATIMYNDRHETNNNELYNMWKGNNPYKAQKIKFFKNRKGLLLKKMFKRLQGENFFNNHVENQQEICQGIFFENGKKQSHEQSCYKRKSKLKIKSYRASSSYKRRKRERTDDSSISFGKRNRLGHGGIRKNRNEKGKRYALCLQNRYCKRNIKNRGRSRRGFSWNVNKSRTRQKENRILDWVRVENIEIQKHRNRKKSGRVCEYDYVYDLEIEDNHNYFANNILVHNCHHIGASTWQKIRSHFYKANLYGTTATPIRLDGYGMGNDFETMVVGKSYDYLVDKGFLSYPIYYVPKNLQLDYDLAHIKKNGYDYNKKQSELILDNHPITGNAIDEYAKLCDKEPALAFCVSIKHAEHVAEEFRNAGYLTEVIHSKIKPEKVAETIEKLRRGELHVVTSCDKVGEGTDIPKLRAVILLRYTASITVNHQQNGRASRPYEGKENSIHIDLVGNCKTHGLINFPIKWELTKGKFEPPVQGVVECEFCMKYYSINLRACPHCGKMRIIKKKKRQDPIVVPGELKRIDYVKLNEEVQKAESLADFHKIAKEVGYKPGWAYHQWKYKQHVKEKV